MRAFPQSGSEWEKFIYFSLRAWVIIAFLGVQLLEMKVRTEHTLDSVNLVLISYVICFLAFLTGSIVQFSTCRHEQAQLNLICAAVTFFLGYCLMPSLF